MTLLKEKNSVGADIVDVMQQEKAAKNASRSLPATKICGKFQQVSSFYSLARQTNGDSNRSPRTTYLVAQEAGASNDRDRS